MRKNPRRILSPQRLPFRHPGKADKEKVAWTRAGSKRIVQVTRLVLRARRPGFCSCLAILHHSLCHKPSESDLRLLTTVLARDSFGSSSIYAAALKMFCEVLQISQPPRQGSRCKLGGPMSLF